MENFEKRMYNYMFCKGDKVRLADDIPHEHKYQKFIGKIGKVKNCTWEGSGFSLGSFYDCEVSFDGEVIKAPTAYFISDNNTLIDEFTKLKLELEPYKNTLVIDDLDQVVRLVDVVYDGSNEFEDFYWVFESKNGIYHASCVSGWVALKGFIPEEKYDRLVRIWNLNHTEQAI